MGLRLEGDEADIVNILDVVGASMACTTTITSSARKSCRTPTSSLLTVQI